MEEIPGGIDQITKLPHPDHQTPCFPNSCTLHTDIAQIPALCTGEPTIFCTLHNLPISALHFARTKLLDSQIPPLCTREPTKSQLSAPTARGNLPTDFLHPAHRTPNFLHSAQSGWSLADSFHSFSPSALTTSIFSGIYSAVTVLTYPLCSKSYWRWISCDQCYGGTWTFLVHLW